MKAITRARYGPPEELRLQELPVPQPKEREVLVRVRATTVNRTDTGILLGKPYLIRAFTGLFKPRSPIPGTDFAGDVEAVGSQVTAFKPGDRLWGLNDEGIASQAQYMVVRHDQAILTIPASITYAQAAASAEGAHYAINFINKIKLQAGQKVMVYGATGAIGSAAVQLLKALDLYVTAVCATPYVDRVKALGPDRVVDYLKEDFTQDTERYHYVLDAVGKSRFRTCKPLLLPGGIYVSSELGPGWENLFLPISTRFSSKRVIFPFPSNRKRSLGIVQDLLEKGRFKPLIDDHTYPMENIADAYRYALSGQKIGNVIISYE
jgi:NADPH:quinone reductase-like Zn-dependent oxidoreductase